MSSAIGMPAPIVTCFPWMDTKRVSIWFAALVDSHCLLCAGNEALELAHLPRQGILVAPNEKRLREILSVDLAHSFVCWRSNSFLKSHLPPPDHERRCSNRLEQSVPPLALALSNRSAIPR